MRRGAKRLKTKESLPLRFRVERLRSDDSRMSTPPRATPSGLTISVYGSTGFIGSNWLASSVHRKHVIERSQRSSPPADGVLYLINSTHNHHVFSDPRLEVETNLLVLAETLANLTPASGTFNFVSSSIVYGPSTGVADESAPCNPVGIHAFAKQMAEQLVVNYCRARSLRYRIFRLSNVIGPGDKASPRKNILQFMLEEMRAGRDVTLFGDGQFFRDFIHVDDAVRALDLCLERAPVDEIFNIGSGKRHRFRDLVETVHRELNSSSRITAVGAPDGTNVFSFEMDVRKLEHLGFTPRLSMEEALFDLCHPNPAAKSA